MKRHRDDQQGGRTKLNRKDLMKRWSVTLVCIIALFIAGCGGGGGGDSTPSDTTGTNGGASFGTATNLPVSGTLSGEITDDAVRDYYSVTTAGEGTVIIIVDGLTDDLIINLYDSSQSKIDMSDDFFDNPELLIYTGPPATYYVEIIAVPGATSPYTITANFYSSGETLPITVDSNDWYDTADRVPSNTVITSSVSGAVDRDFYVFTLDAPATINFEMTDSTSTFGLSLYDESQTAVGYSGTLISYAAQAGTYYAEVYSWQGSAGDYTITINTTP